MTTEDKISKIYDNVTELKIELARYLVHQENHAKKLDGHEDQLFILEADRNTSLGKRTILTAGVSATVGGFVAWLVKHFST